MLFSPEKKNKQRPPCRSYVNAAVLAVFVALCGLCWPNAFAPRVPLCPLVLTMALNLRSTAWCRVRKRSWPSTRARRATSPRSRACCWPRSPRPMGACPMSTTSKCTTLVAPVRLHVVGLTDRSSISQQAYLPLHRGGPDHVSLHGGRRSQAPRAVPVPRGHEGMDKDPCVERTRLLYCTKREKILTMRLEWVDPLGAVQSHVRRSRSHGHRVRHE